MAQTGIGAVVSCSQYHHAVPMGPNIADCRFPIGFPVFKFKAQHSIDSLLLDFV